jgi:hypothetical protein
MQTETTLDDDLVPTFRQRYGPPRIIRTGKLSHGELRRIQSGSDPKSELAKIYLTHIRKFS